MNDVVLESRELVRTYTTGPADVQVLKGISLQVQAGEQLAIVGASGSGKSTLLHLLGGLSKPTQGEVWVDGQDISSLSAKEQGVLRNHALGFVYQFHHLLAEFTARNNTALQTLVNEHHVDVREFPKPVLDKLRALSEKVVDEIAGQDALSARVSASYQNFRQQVVAWHDISERTYLNVRG